MKPVAFALGRSSFCEPTPFQRERSVHATVRAVAKKNVVMTMLHRVSPVLRVYNTGLFTPAKCAFWLLIYMY